MQHTSTVSYNVDITFQLSPCHHENSDHYHRIMEVYRSCSCFVVKVPLYCSAWWAFLSLRAPRRTSWQKSSVASLSCLFQYANMFLLCGERKKRKKGPKSRCRVKRIKVGCCIEWDTMQNKSWMEVLWLISGWRLAFDIWVCARFPGVYFKSRSKSKLENLIVGLILLSDAGFDIFHTGFVSLCHVIG